MRILIFASMLICGLMSTNIVKAELVFDLSEGNGTVEVLLSGSVNLDATFGNTGFAPNVRRFFDASRGGVAVGEAAASDRYEIVLATPFGNGGFFQTNVGSGDRVALFVDRFLGVPLGYVSGDPLSGTASFTGDFDSLGITEGTFVTSFSNNGVTDNIVVTTVAVPEPTSLLVVFGFTALLGLPRRRKD